MNEKDFQNYFIQKFKPYAHRISLVTSNGFPDVLMIINNKHFLLIELKYLPNNPTPKRKVLPLYTKNQIAWYYKHKEQVKDNYFTIIKTPDYYYYQKTQYMIETKNYIFGQMMREKKIKDIAFLAGIEYLVDE